MSVGAVEQVKQRIAEIQAQFSAPQVAAQTGAKSGDFASVLGLAMSGRDKGLGGLAASLNPEDDNTNRINGSDVIENAKQYLGVPYLWGGTDPSKGLDCSGFIQLVYKNLGMSLPRVAADQARQGTAVPSLAEAKPGDLVAFGSPVDHIGIYVGDNKMIVAPRRGDVVKIQDVYKTPTAIRRIIPDTQAAGFNALTPSAHRASSGQIDGSLRSQYDNLFVSAGAKYGISPNLLAAVAKQESGFNANARSSAGAQGLMQIMPGTAKGLKVNPMNPVEAVDGAAKMLSGLVSKFGSVELALAGYNAGPGAVQKYGGIPPYKETQNYVRNIMAMVR